MNKISINKVLWVFNIICYVYIALNFNNFINGLSLIKTVWHERTIITSLDITEEIKVSGGYPYEYCSMIEDIVYSDSTYYNAGTPIPTQPVIINTPIVINQITETPVADVLQPEKIEQIVSENLAIPDLTVNVSEMNSDNHQVVIVAAGFSNNTEITGIMYDVESAFNGINVDFIYVNETVNLEFVRVAQTTMFTDSKVESELIRKVRDVYRDVDSVVIVVNTNDWVGTSSFGLTIQPPVFYSLVHEIGHQIGMSDGYQDFYDSKSLSALPNNELFFLDSMPASLVKAFKELGYTPPTYLVGTCNGRDVYTFYESQNNIYGDYSPDGNPSWGNESVFTPLQVIIMNNYIESEK